MFKDIFLSSSHEDKNVDAIKKGEKRDFKFYGTREKLRTYAQARHELEEN